MAAGRTRLRPSGRMPRRNSGHRDRCTRPGPRGRGEPMRLIHRLRQSCEAGAALAVVLFLALLFAGPAAAQFAGGGGTTGITLSIANWVPARDKSYGGWGVARAGESIAKPLMWTNTAPSLTLPAGSYDL